MRAASARSGLGEVQHHRQRRQPEQQRQQRANQGAARGGGMRQRECAHHENPADGNDQHFVMWIAVLRNENAAGFS
jgi:hypothetical protein